MQEYDAYGATHFGRREFAQRWGALRMEAPARDMQQCVAGGGALVLPKEPKEPAGRLLSPPTATAPPVPPAPAAPAAPPKPAVPPEPEPEPEPEPAASSSSASPPSTTRPGQ
jgi:hypothetical protein